MSKKERREQFSLLIVNPNSSTSVTEALVDVYIRYAPREAILRYWTAPPSAPAAINDTATSEQSCEACLPLLLPLLDEYDGFLIACYSAHPLVPKLRQNTSKPVIGIFESSITHALLHPGKFGIVTTGPAWEPLLAEGVNVFLGGQSERFVGVKSTGLGVLELHEAPADVVKAKLCAAALELVERGASSLCLGCAGMAGLGDAVADVLVAHPKVSVIDITSGLWELTGLVRCRL